MKRSIACLIFFMAFMLTPANAAKKDSVVLLYAPLPSLPEQCAGQETLSGDGLRFVSVIGNIDWEGRATQVQVLEPSDDCLKDAAIETVRLWKFEPNVTTNKNFFPKALERR